METKDVLLRLIQLHPRLTRYRLAKMTYLLDLAMIQMGHEPVSGVGFISDNYGPYSVAIVDAAEALQKEGRISIDHSRNEYGNCCFFHIAQDSEAVSLDPTVESAMKYVLERFADRKYEELETFVYNTKPMKDIEIGSPTYHPLDMEVDHEDGIMRSPEVAKQVVMGAYDTRPGRTLDELFLELGAGATE